MLDGGRKVRVARKSGETIDLSRAATMTRLHEHYEKVVKPAPTREFSYKNAMEVPQLDKIVVNMGVSEAVPTDKIRCSTRRATS